LLQAAGLWRETDLHVLHEAETVVVYVSPVAEIMGEWLRLLGQPSHIPHTTWTVLQPTYQIDQSGPPSAFTYSRANGLIPLPARANALPLEVVPTWEPPDPRAGGSKRLRKVLAHPVRTALVRRREQAEQPEVHCRCLAGRRELDDEKIVGVGRGRPWLEREGVLRVRAGDLRDGRGARIDGLGVCALQGDAHGAGVGGGLDVEGAGVRRVAGDLDAWAALESWFVIR
jgi:hypothetical protein